MQKFSELVIKCRKPIILLTILNTLVLGYFLKDIRINPDIISYLPEEDPVVKVFNRIGEEYGGNQLAIIAIETDNIFNKETIERISYLTTQFRFVEGVSHVTSIANVLDIRKVEDGVEIGRLIDPYNLPRESEAIQELKRYTLSKDMFRGRLVSEDATIALIVCRVMYDADKIETAKSLKEIVENAHLKERVYYGGFPFAMLDANEIIMSDLKTLTPLICILIAVLLFVGFRTLKGVLLPIVSVIMSTIWVLGIMSILEIPLTTVSNVIPVILIAVGSAYAIHVINKFNEDVSTNENRIEQSRKALSEIATPVILTAITTMIGFISFVFGSYLIMVQEFGIFSALGILFTLIISVTFIPSVLSLLPVKSRTAVSRSPEKRAVFDWFMDKISEWVLKNGKLIIVGGVILVIICILGAPKIERRVDILDYFKPDSDIRVTEEMMQDKFGGTIPVQILVTGDIQDPLVLSEMKKMKDFLESQDVYNPWSMVDLIEEMNYAMGEGRVIPDSREKVSNLWFLVEGEEMLEQLVNDDQTEAVIHATISNIDTERMRKLVGNIDEYIRKMDNSQFTFEQTGMPPIYNQLDASLMRSQIQSLIIATILVFLCLSFQLHSFKGGLIGITPIGLSLLGIFGLIGFTGIPLDAATVLVGSISIGIGIDYSIHFMNCFSEEFKKSNTELEALSRTLKTAGRAITINTVTVMMGFLVLLLADLIPLRRFGFMVAIVMLISGMATFYLLPAIILLTKAGFIGDFEKFKSRVKNSLLNNKGCVNFMNKPQRSQRERR